MCPMLPLMSEALSYCFIISSLYPEWLWTQHTAACKLSLCVITCHKISWSYCVVLVATVTGECMFVVLFYFRLKLSGTFTWSNTWNLPQIAKYLAVTSNLKAFLCGSVFFLAHHIIRSVSILFSLIVIDAVHFVGKEKWGVIYKWINQGRVALEAFFLHRFSPSTPTSPN